MDKQPMNAEEFEKYLFDKTVMFLANNRFGGDPKWQLEYETARLELRARLQNEEKWKAKADKLAKALEIIKGYCQNLPGNGFMASKKSIERVDAALDDYKKE